MNRKKNDIDKVYQKNYVTCISCNKSFHRPKSKVKSDNIFCSIVCKATGMSNGDTKPMRKGTGLYDKVTPLIRRKYYKYKSRDNDKFSIDLDYTVDDFIKNIKDGECYYCGDKEKLGYDRINNNKGHISSNVVICCELCNMTRGDRYSMEEMILLGKVIKKIKKNR